MAANVQDEDYSEQSDSSSDNSEEGDSAPETTGNGKWGNIGELSARHILGLQFRSFNEAEEFYREYAKYHGFAVRKDEARKNKDNQVVLKVFVCNRAGHRNPKHLNRTDRKRDPRPITRIDCPAYLRIRYNSRKSRWLVKRFVEGHNHDLTPARFVHLYPAYRGMNDADRAQVDSLQSHGVRTCHIMGYMVAQKGGHSSLGFCKKDLYNYLDAKMRNEIKDGDAAAAITYFRGKSECDPYMFSKYQLAEGKLRTLFWADGTSRTDYLCFGEVVAFDTTYKRNRYNYPLVIFSGCNHHNQTVIFGAALVSDETVESYQWLLTQFLEAMGNKQPKAVVTDGDQAMKEAIRTVFPDASHRLCAWHLNKNATDNIKNQDFAKDFKKAMYKNSTPEEFELFWESMVDRHGLKANEWVSKTYTNKNFWATAYFRDKFFARIRTTSQCEAINGLVKAYVRKRCSIFEFIQNFDNILRDYRNNELVADFKSISSEPLLLTSLRPIERHAATTYTAEIFIKVRKQLVKSGQMIVSKKEEEDGDKIIKFKLTKYCDTDYVRNVVHDTSQSTFDCDCKRFERFGLPCSHIFTAMREQHILRIPESLILTRWTKNAKDFLIPTALSGVVDADTMEAARFSAFSAACTKFCKLAAGKKERFNEIMEEIHKLIAKYENPAGVAPPPCDQDVGDPDVVKSKGAQKKCTYPYKKTRRRCTVCGKSDHNARTCNVTPSPGKLPVDDSHLSGADDVEESMADKSESTRTSQQWEQAKGRVPITSLRTPKKEQETQSSDTERQVSFSSQNILPRHHPNTVQFQNPGQNPMMGPGPLNYETMGYVHQSHVVQDWPQHHANVFPPLLYYAAMAPPQQMMQQVAPKGGETSGTSKSKSKSKSKPKPKPKPKDPPK